MLVHEPVFRLGCFEKMVNAFFGISRSSFFSLQSPQFLIPWFLVPLTRKTVCRVFFMPPFPSVQQILVNPKATGYVTD
jgi:hypothetical protein